MKGKHKYCTDYATVNNFSHYQQLYFEKIDPQSVNPQRVMMVFQMLFIL